jgi:hypothetical protein
MRACEGILAVVALLSLAGCGDLVLEGNPPELQGPRCPQGQVLDPSTLACVPKPCRSSDDCEADQRCEPIGGTCVPLEEPPAVR